jgi:hypothetical protein
MYLFAGLAIVPVPYPLDVGQALFLKSDFYGINAALIL